jgi:sec-independent protein translocase protein TatC
MRSPNHADDLFADTRMSFGDHLEDLRRCLWRGLAGFLLIVVLVFVCDLAGCVTGTRFGVGRPVLAMIAAPVEQALQQLYDRRAQRLLDQMGQAETDGSRDVPVVVDLGELADQLAPVLGLRPPAGVPDAERRVVVLHGRLAHRTWAEMWLDAEKRLGRRPAVQTFGVAEALTVYLKVALLCGVVLGSPWLFFQAWAFVAAGLYPAEKRWVRVYLPVSIVLFLAGAAVCQLVVLPKAVAALLWFNEWLGFEPNLRLSEWLGFALLLPVVFGLSFQLPLVMLVTERLGLVSARTYAARWRWALFLVHLFAAAVMPTPDWLSMESLALPLFGLYGLGILLCRLTPHRPVRAGVGRAELVEV